MSLSLFYIHTDTGPSGERVLEGEARRLAALRLLWLLVILLVLVHGRRRLLVLVAWRLLLLLHVRWLLLLVLLPRGCRGRGRIGGGGGRGSRSGGRGDAHGGLLRLLGRLLGVAIGARRRLQWLLL